MPTSAKKLMRKIKPGQHGKSKICQEWSRCFLKATDHDRWQQELLAHSEYESLHEDIELFIERGTSEMNNIRLEITDEQNKILQKVAYCIYCRMMALKTHCSYTWMTLDELMKIKPVLKDILTWKAVFPVLIRKEQAGTKSEVSLLSNDSGLGENEVSSSEDSDNDIEKDDDEDDGDNDLLPRLPKQTGLTRMSLHIEKIGLKEIGLVEPYINVSVRDSCSVNLTPHQFTSAPVDVKDHHLLFDTRIEIQKYIEHIPKQSNIFFELRHKKQGRMTTKCFAILRRNEFETTKGYLELYKGPTDYHLKRMERYTSKKPLYLHVDIKILK